ncbi:MAG: ethylbenzene dehydrogenase-related protein [Magnetococcus sp. DMHC-1]
MPLNVPVVVDGELGDWNAQGMREGRLLSLTDSEWEVDAATGKDAPLKEKKLRVWFGHHGERLYFAAQWSDETMNALYKPWKLSGNGYQRSRALDDMLVVRWQMGESFSQCMLSSTQYRTDVWRWSAGRSNLSGFADDMQHLFSNKPFDKPAREYEGNKGTVYFQNAMDEGIPGWQTEPTPKPESGPVVPSIVKVGEASGSRADVTAAGRWKDGVWTVEMSRLLKTRDPNDVVLEVGGERVVQFAVFNAGYRLEKLITSPFRARLLPGEGGR